MPMSMRESDKAKQVGRSWGQSGRSIQLCPYTKPSLIRAFLKGHEQGEKDRKRERK